MEIINFHGHCQINSDDIVKNSAEKIMSSEISEENPCWNQFEKFEANFKKGPKPYMTSGINLKIACEF